MKNFEQSYNDHMNYIYNDPCLEDYETDEDENILSPCCGEILDEDNMICPECKEHC